MSNLRGIGLMVLAMALFAVGDTFIKFAGRAVPAPMILLLLGLGGSAIFWVLCRARGLRVLSPLLLDPAVLVRNLAEAFGSFCIVTALTLAPLSLVAAINQANPLLVTMGAALFLGERVGPRRWAAVGVGLMGVLLMLRPDAAGLSPGALLAVGAVVGLSIRDVATRRAPKEAAGLQLTAWSFAVQIPAGALLTAVAGGPVLPGPSDLGLIAAAVAATGAAVFAITASLRSGEVSVVAPFRYSRMVFALILGVAAFGERPDATTLLGAAIVIGSGLYVFAREGRRAPAGTSGAGPR